jgi:hypothetical protein
MVLSDYQQTSVHLTVLDTGIAEFEAEGEVKVDDGDVKEDEVDVDKDSDELEDEEVNGFV